MRIVLRASRRWFVACSCTKFTHYYSDNFRFPKWGTKRLTKPFIQYVYRRKCCIPYNTNTVLCNQTPGFVSLYNFKNGRASSPKDHTLEAGRLPRTTSVVERVYFRDELMALTFIKHIDHLEYRGRRDVHSGVNWRIWRAMGSWVWTTHVYMPWLLDCWSFVLYRGRYYTLKYPHP